MNLSRAIMIVIICGLFLPMEILATGVEESTSQKGIPMKERLVLDPNSNILIKSLDFRTSDLKDVLRNLFQLIDVNVIIEPAVFGEITLSFKNTKVEEALNLIMDNQKLTWKWVGKTVVIDRDINAGPQLITKTIELRNRKPEELCNFLWGALTYGIGTFSFDTCSNTITLTDEKPVVEICSRVLSSIDINSGNYKELVPCQTGFIGFGTNTVVLGNNVLSIKLEKAVNSSDSTTLVVYLSDGAQNCDTRIGEFTYNSTEIGSGTSREVVVNCKVFVSVTEKDSGKPLSLCPH
ncbi:MAG: hypothetical protein WA705_13770 [Candidatus Ozemobacteraceae bacterium]